MAMRCDICAKQTRSGSNVSHSNRKTKRKWKPNIQKIRVASGGSAKRINVCTRCIRSGKANRAI